MVIDLALRDAVLERLGLGAPPAPDAAGLTLLYRAWCRAVPFDNLRKLISLRGGDAGPLPGLDPADFFTAFLAHRTGGTCWPSNEAMLALLMSSGIEARRAAATMLPVPIPPDSPHRPNHGTTIATIEGDEYVVDTSMLSEHPLLLDRSAERVSTPDPVVGIDADRDGDRWTLHFQPWRPGGRLACELETTPIGPEVPSLRYEYSRARSPFNDTVHARRNLAEYVVIVALGQVFRIDRATGASVPEDLEGNRARRDAVLIDELGYSNEIVAALPADTVTA